MKNSLLVMILGICVVSCHKEELPIPKHDSGDAIEVQVAMGDDYRTQLYYDLGQNAVISSNDKVDWDLAFESSANGAHILLNSSRGMSIHRGSGGFGDLTSEVGLSWNWDARSGNLDSTAVGDWQTDAGLYVINMGYNHLGTHLGYKKMQITAMTATSFTVEFGDLSDATPQSVSIAKNADNLFTYFKFGTGAVSIAPPNETWDLLFTQYTHLFYDPFEAYVVSGVLLNRYNTEASRITNKSFAEVTFEDANELTYSNNLDYIGYDWKVYDFTDAIYIVDPTITYIVKTSEGLYYKLHFVDFYNSLGEKGHPKLEIQQL